MIDAITLCMAIVYIWRGVEANKIHTWNASSYVVCFLSFSSCLLIHGPVVITWVGILSQAEEDAKGARSSFLADPYMWIPGIEEVEYHIRITEFIYRILYQNQHTVRQQSFCIDDCSHKDHDDVDEFSGVEFSSAGSAARELLILGHIRLTSGGRTTYLPSTTIHKWNHPLSN